MLKEKFAFATSAIIKTLPVKFMPVIRIPDLLLKRLKAASNEGDITVSIINRLLSEYETHYNIQPFGHEDCIVIDPDSPENLDRTRVMRAIVGEQEIYIPNWNKIVDAIHEIAVWQQMTPERLIDLTLSHVVEGEKRDSGFHYLLRANISIQGVGANIAQRAMLCT